MKPSDSLEDARRKLSLAYQKALKDAKSKEDLYKSSPLNEVAKAERIYRLHFLDDIELAKEADDFYQEYAKRYPMILTPDANYLLRKFNERRKTSQEQGFMQGIYITEISVPPTGDLNHHTVKIDLVTFLELYPTIKTLDTYFAGALSFLRIPPSFKSIPGHEYVSCESQTFKYPSGKTEKTKLKLRKRVLTPRWDLDTEEAERDKKLITEILESRPSMFR